MNFFEQEYTHEDLLRRCNPNVLYGTRKIELSDRQDGKNLWRSRHLPECGLPSLKTDALIF